MQSYADSLGPSYVATMPTVAEALCQVLAHFGCHEIHGYPGDYVAGLVAVLDQRFHLRPSANEAHAAFSACASAELEGFGCCLTTYTVGSLPCASAMALAVAERLPVLFLSGAPGEEEARQPAALHHTLWRADSWNSGDDHVLEVARALGVEAIRLSGPRNPWQPPIVAQLLFDTLERAVAERRPLFVEVPRDLLRQPSQALRLPEPEPATFPRSLRAEARLLADHICERLLAARRPLLYYGEKLKHRSDLRASVLRLCEQLRLPMVGNVYAKGMMPADHPLNLGVYNGAFSTAWSVDYVESADFVLELGTSTRRQDVSSALGTGTHVLEQRVDKVAIIGSAPAEQDELALVEELLERTRDLPAFATSLPQAPAPRERSDWSETEGIGWADVYAALRGAAHEVGRGLVHAVEIGSAFFAGFPADTAPASVDRGWLCNPWYGAMGTTLAYARAACHVLAQASPPAPDVVVALLGDGGFHFQCNELVHMQREGLSLLVLYLDNSRLEFGRCSDAEVYRTTAPEFGLDRLAAAYGADYRRVDTVPGLYDAVAEYLKEPTGIRIIDVNLDAKRCRRDPTIAAFQRYIEARARR